jgi:hypothetical protein
MVFDAPNLLVRAVCGQIDSLSEIDRDAGERLAAVSARQEGAGTRGEILAQDFRVLDGNRSTSRHDCG